MNSEKGIVKNGENNRRNRAGPVLLGRHTFDTLRAGSELFREGSIHLHLQTYHPIILQPGYLFLNLELLNFSTFEHTLRCKGG